MISIKHQRVCFMLAAIVVLFAVAASVGKAEMRFDSAVWKNDELTQSSEYPRIKMIDDLIARYDLNGMPKEKIDELLGVPPLTEYFKGYDYVYWLGPERGFMGIDSEWLCIKFDNGKVSEAKVLSD